MSEPLTTQLNQPSPWLTYLGPMILSVLASFVAVTYFAGAYAQRITANDTAITEQKELNKSFTTREEARIRDESISSQLKEIQENVRAIRSNVEHK